MTNINEINIRKIYQALDRYENYVNVVFLLDKVIIQNIYGDDVTLNVEIIESESIVIIREKIYKKLKLDDDYLIDAYILDAI